MPLHLVDKDRIVEYYMKEGVKYDAIICGAVYMNMGHGEEPRLSPAYIPRHIKVSDKMRLIEYAHNMNKLDVGDVFEYIDDVAKDRLLFVVLPNNETEKTLKVLQLCYSNVLKYAVKHNYKSIIMEVFFIGTMLYDTRDAYDAAKTVIYRILSNNHDVNIYLDPRFDCRPIESIKYIHKNSKARLNPDWESEYEDIMDDTDLLRYNVSSMTATPLYPEPKVIVERVTELVYSIPRFDRSKFRKCIEEYLKNASITQTKLANRACIDKGTINRLMDYKSESKPKKNTVVSLAIAMELDKDKRKEFIVLGGYPYPYDERDKKIEEYINNGDKTVMSINLKLLEDNFSVLSKDSYNTEKKSRKNKITNPVKKLNKTAKGRS